MQTWNDILKYIKINLGAPLNRLEISDEDIVKNLREQVLPFFSQYAPAKNFRIITNVNLIAGIGGEPIYQYKILLSPEEYIIDVLNVYHTRNSSIIDILTPIITTTEQVIDTIIYNSYSDLVRSMQAVNTWEFIPPDKLLFDFEVSFGIVEYNTVHQELKTIEPDKYHIMFKKLCLANVKIWIASMRSKFNTIATQFGPLDLNWETLKQEGMQEKEEVTQLLNMIPPDYLLHIDF
jgi:hypothetical protein